MKVDPVIMPIEIRPDYCVQIMGIPHDLTAEEARKIASVILAMASSRSAAEARERGLREALAELLAIAETFLPLADDDDSPLLRAVERARKALAIE